MHSLSSGERQADSHLTVDGSPEEAMPGTWGASQGWTGCAELLV